MNKKLVLGTANFGNVYGISNSSLRLPLVDKEIAERLVARAVSIGIDTFDTAQNYGPSLGWITDFSKDMKLRIWSKVSWIPDEFQDFQNFTDYISKYFDNHGRENLELLQLHNWTPSLKPSEIERRIDFIRDEWKIKVGATTYGTESAFEATKYFDSIQIECNLLNKHAYLNVRDKLGDDQILNVRSLFLQGLLLKDSSSVDQKYNELMPALKRIDLIVNESGIDKNEFITRWLHELDGVSGFVVGVDSTEQLDEIASNFAKGSLPRECVTKLESIENLKLKMADPRNWNSL